MTENNDVIETVALPSSPVPAVEVEEVALSLELYRHNQQGLKAIAHLHLVNDDSHEGQDGVTINRIGLAQRERAHAQLDEFFDEVNRRWDYLMGDKFTTIDQVPDRELLLMGFLGDGIPLPVGATTRWETLQQKMLALAEGNVERLEAEVRIAIAAIRASVQALRTRQSQSGSPIVQADGLEQLP